MSDKYISVKVLEEIMRRHKPEYGQDKSKERYAYIEWLGILNSIRRECQPIEAAPAVDSAQWIPVTERMPEDSGVYLVCPSDSVLEDYSDFSEVMMMPYDADCEAFGWWIEHYDPVSLGFVDSDFREFKVTAWMPLPEPYREGKR